MQLDLDGRWSRRIEAAPFTAVPWEVESERRDSIDELAHRLLDSGFFIVVAMCKRINFTLAMFLLFVLVASAGAFEPKTQVAVDGDIWLVNGSPTNAGSDAEGLLLNSRMVQATFEDRNPETVDNWSYPDGSPYDPYRQTQEFIDMVPTYAAYGLDAVTVSLQGGRPMRGDQVWINSAFDADGSLRDDYLERMARVIEALDESGMVAILSYFYFGQDQNFEDEEAIYRALDGATDWVLDQGYTNVLIEVVNEADHSHYHYELLNENNVHELVERVQSRAEGALLVSASMGGGNIPPEELVAVSDFHLPHGNSQTAERVAEMVPEIRELDSYAGEPIVFNEDSTSLENMAAALSQGASWGYYDQGDNNYRDGFQSPPTNWEINTDEKKAFFDKVARLTDSEVPASD